MPDWITHLGTTWILCRLAGIKQKERSIMLLGSLLPDLYKIATIYHLVTGSSPQLLYRFFKGVPTPLGSLLLAGMVASFFEKENYKKIFAFLFAAASFHLLLDSLMYPWGDQGIRIFWPISNEKVGFGLFWPNDAKPMILTLLGVVLLEGSFQLKDWESYG